MEYKKINEQGINVHLINTDRFKTISIDICFSREFNIKEVIYLNLLTNVLISSTKKYKNAREISIIGEELYGAELMSSSSIMGKIENIKVSLEFLNPIYTSDDMISESIDFLIECLTNPNVKNNAFDSQYFNISKNNIVSSLKDIYDNAVPYSFVKFRELMFKGSPNEFHLLNYMDEFMEITPEDLYEFYKKVLSTSKIDIFVTGKIENEELYLKNIKKLLKKINTNYNGSLCPIINEKKRSLIEKKDTRNFSQSSLYVGYQFLDLNDYERKYLLHFYSLILGNINNSVLFKKLREENSLCYTISSFINRYPAALVIETEINKENYDKALKLIDESIKDMLDINKIKSLFETAKNTVDTSLNSFYDDKEQMINYYFFGEFDVIDDVETRRKKFMNIKLEEIIELNKKMNKSVIYFLEGSGENEENNI